MLKRLSHKSASDYENSCSGNSSPTEHSIMIIHEHQNSNICTSSLKHHSSIFYTPNKLTALNNDSYSEHKIVPAAQLFRMDDSNEDVADDPDQLNQPKKKSGKYQKCIKALKFADMELKASKEKQNQMRNLNHDSDISEDNDNEQVRNTQIAKKGRRIFGEQLNKKDDQTNIQTITEQDRSLMCFDH